MKQLTNMPVAALDEEGRLLARLSSRSALATDFAMLMARVPDHQAATFRAAVLAGNILARSSSSARKKVFQELKGRYLLDPNFSLFEAFLFEWRRYQSPEDRRFLAYVFFTLNDRMVYVTSRDWLFPRLRQASSELRLGDLIDFLHGLGKSDYPEIAAWTRTTLIRVAQHYLASIRDFGLASGGRRKIALRPSLPPAAVRLILRALALKGIPAAEVVRHEAFKILGIAPHEVVDVLSELNRHESLHFRMQADVIELSL